MCYHGNICICYHHNISMCCMFPVQCLHGRASSLGEILLLLSAVARFFSRGKSSTTLSLGVLSFSDKIFFRSLRWRAFALGGKLHSLSAGSQTGGGVSCMQGEDDGKPPALGERLCGGPFPWGRGLWGCGMRAGVPRGACLSLQECLHLLCRLLPGGDGAHHQACARG